MHRPLVALPLLAASSAPLAAQHFHRLPATPGTVAYGYYSAAATPVLRIASGDTVLVETLIRNRPRPPGSGGRRAGRRAAVPARPRQRGHR